jgi:hypothetical protein
VALFIVFPAVVGAGLWAWSTYCEDYGLCSPACRVASNGIETWTRLPPVIRQSGPIAATASPGTECLALLEGMRAAHPGKAVAIDTVNMAGERRPAPFHRYDCTFDIQQPVYALSRNPECPEKSP